MTKITATIYINNDTSNPIAISAVINGTYENGPGWDWSIEEIKVVELLISDKEGIDITKQVLNNPRAKALLISQIENEDDQVFDALTETIDVNEEVDRMMEGQRERRTI